MKKYKKSCNNNKLKIQLEHGMKNFNYLIDYILYQIFNIILSTYLKRMEKIQSMLRHEYI